MKKILTSVGLVAIGAASAQAATPLDRSYYAPNPALTSPERSKLWSVSASLRGFYDDNYFTSPSSYIDPATGAVLKPRSSFGFEVSPRASLNAALEQTFIGLSYQYSLRWYADRKTNSADHSHQADLNLNHSFSENLKLEAKDSFVLSQEPQLLDPSVVTAPLRRSNLDNLRNAADLSLHADISRAFSTTFGYANTLYDYKQSGAGGYAANLDRMEHLAKIDFRWNAQPNTIALIGYQYGLIDHTSKDSLLSFDPLKTLAMSDSKIRDNHSHYIFAGADQTFANQILASVRVGAQITEYPNALAGSEKNSTTPYADANLSYGYSKGGSVQLGVRHARNQTDVTYINLADQTATLDQETTTIYASLTHQITANLMGSLVGQVQDSTFNGGKDSNGTKYKQTDDLYMIGFSLNYKFNEYWGAELGYNYDRLDSEINARGFTRNRVFIGLRASY
ncbi:MAG: outer membrane beta-barrel protein [Verrucomicrobia bacterium]|nr:outer membrane beta-barrel protein [Verrucomicrobiota bacterium]